MDTLEGAAENPRVSADHSLRTAVLEGSIQTFMLINPLTDLLVHDMGYQKLATTGLPLRKYFLKTEKIPHRRIRAHYEQLSEFERGLIIELKEAGWANRRITHHMGRSDTVIRRCCDKSRFRLCPDDHQRRAWRRPGQHADLAFIIARYTGPQPGVMVWGAISFGRFTSLVVIRAHLQYSGTSTTF
ncbi:transposable element Tc1 transposase [Trichonephila clavipes]|nr:transposable element Tc1 transposase [Trichonephila clavipes]